MKLLTIPEVAEECQVSEGAVRKWVSAKLIEHMKLGRCIRFKREWVEKYQKQRTQRSIV